MNKTSLVLIICLLFMLLAGIPATAQGPTECEDGFRLFDHELLATDSVCIPENPQHIVAFGIPAIEPQSA